MSSASFAVRYQCKSEFIIVYSYCDIGHNHAGYCQLFWTPQCHVCSHPHHLPTSFSGLLRPKSCSFAQFIHVYSQIIPIPGIWDIHSIPSLLFHRYYMIKPRWIPSLMIFPWVNHWKWRSSPGVVDKAPLWRQRFVVHTLGLSQSLDWFKGENHGKR